MRGKIVNLCIGFMNILFGVLILIYTLNVPQDQTLLTVQEQAVTKIILFGNIKLIYFSYFLYTFVISFNFLMLIVVTY